MGGIGIAGRGTASGVEGALGVARGGCCCLLCLYVSCCMLISFVFYTRYINKHEIKVEEHHFFHEYV